MTITCDIQLVIGVKRLYTAWNSVITDLFYRDLLSFTVVQYPSIKSLRSTIVERSFNGASVCVSFQTKRCENGNGTERSENGV